MLENVEFLECAFRLWSCCHCNRQLHFCVIRQVKFNISFKIMVISLVERPWSIGFVWADNNRNFCRTDYERQPSIQILKFTKHAYLFSTKTVIDYSISSGLALIHLWKHRDLVIWDLIHMKYLFCASHSYATFSVCICFALSLEGNIIYYGKWV